MGVQRAEREPVGGKIEGGARVANEVGRLKAREEGKMTREVEWGLGHKGEAPGFVSHLSHPLTPQAGS